MQHDRPDVNWVTWRNMDPQGQILFCKICVTIRASKAVVVDISTLNFNVMFELGYAIGLGIPVLTIKDPTVNQDSKVWRDVGLLDTLAYEPYTNVDELCRALDKAPSIQPLSQPSHALDHQQPVYVIKSPIPVQGSIALQSALKKARIRYRSFDNVETPRLSLMEAQRQVAMSMGVVADLLDESRNREDHNLRGAFVAGLAMAQQKAVLMVQEEFKRTDHPLDYRDVVKTYNSSINVPGLARKFFEDVVERLQTQQAPVEQDSTNPLVALDLGDVAAENEILGLQSYFLKTGPSIQAQQGHARLVVGRKGSGKTAIFYNVRSAVKRGHDRLIIDLKPEGHQFIELKETLLDGVGEGLREHTLVALWQYLLTSEVARYALERDRESARLNPLSLERYESLRDAYGAHDPGPELDFSQRLTYQIDRISRQLQGIPAVELSGKLTEVMYLGNNRELARAVREYIREKESVWLLVDNLDKGWPIRGASNLDILVIRAILEATRKLQREFSREDVEFHTLVFLRSDIYELLSADIPDKGKDTPIALDWNDRKAFEQLMLLRFGSTGHDADDFESAWSRICEPLIDGQASFDYIVDRTLMRPRDLLRFIRACVGVALNRGNRRIEAADIKQAEDIYSLDLTTDFSYEITDTRPELDELLWVFENADIEMSWSTAVDRVVQLLALDESAAESSLEFLLWLGFFGVRASGTESARYSYEVGGNAKRLTFSIRNGDGALVMHPAFRASLGCAAS